MKKANRPCSIQYGNFVLAYRNFLLVLRLCIEKKIHTQEISYLGLSHKFRGSPKEKKNSIKREKKWKERD